MSYRSRGFTLIELMITLLLSSILIAAIGKVFVDSSTAFRKQKNLSYLVEDGRYAQQLLMRELRRTSFLRNKLETNGTDAKVFITDNNVFNSGINLNFGAGESIRGIFKNGGINDEFDINHFIIRYQLNDKNDLPSTTSTTFDDSPCTRDVHLNKSEDPAVKPPHVVTIYFYVKFDKDTNTPVLYCKAKRETINTDTATATLIKISPKAVPLISNVEKMYVLYGVDTGTDNIPNQYLQADADKFTKDKKWKNVVSVRLFLVLRSEDKNFIYNKSQYKINGRTHMVKPSKLDPYADKRLYKVFTTTISLRNKIGEVT